MHYGSNIISMDVKKSPVVIPIPGMRSDERIEENLSAVNVELSDDEYISSKMNWAK